MNDSISRKAVLSILHNKAFDSVRNDKKYNLLRWCMKQIENLPTIKAQGIDKDRLIRDLNLNTNYGFYGEFTDGSEVAFTLRELMEIINQQPTTDGWIPCSERLPEKEDLSDDGFVLVQEGQGAMFKGRYDTDMSTWYDDVGLTFCNGVIAWQPLPQPYKENKQSYAKKHGINRVFLEQFFFRCVTKSQMLIFKADKC